MKKALVLSMVFVATALCMMRVAGAGSLEPTGPPTAGTTLPIWQIHDKTFVDWYLAPNRWALCNNGTPSDGSDDIVLDKETGLMWPRNANLLGQSTWFDAVTFCLNLIMGGRKGWRLPTVEELATLVDPSQSNPALPANHPFLNVQLNDNYWSSTTEAGSPNYAWDVSMAISYVNIGDKLNPSYVWPVRGGSNPTY